MRAEPARLAHAGGKFPARIGAVAAGLGANVMVDGAPGQNALRGVEDFIGGIVIDIGRDHGADAALAEAPGGGCIGLGDLLLHLHEGGERHFGAAEALRQQGAVHAVLDQRGDDRLGQPARALDLVGFADDQGRQRPRAFDEVDSTCLVHAAPRALLDCCLAGGRMVAHPPGAIKTGGAPL